MQKEFVIYIDLLDESHYNNIKNIYKLARWTYTPAIMIGNLRTKKIVYYGAWADNNLIGLISVDLTPEKFGLIRKLFVNPNYRRLGIATKLITTAEKHLTDKHCQRAYLHVDVDNRKAIDLYTKLGYQIKRILHKYYKQSQTDAYEMDKHLFAS